MASTATDDIAAATLDVLPVGTPILYWAYRFDTDVNRRRGMFLDGVVERVLDNGRIEVTDGTQVHPEDINFPKGTDQAVIDRWTEFFIAVYDAEWTAALARHGITR